MKLISESDYSYNVMPHRKKWSQCSLGENGCMFLIFCFWMSIANSSVSETVTISTIEEFCSKNLYVHNIEPGNQYKLILRSKKNSTEFAKWFQKSKRQCRKELKTSDPGSHFVVLISNMTILPSCENCQCSFLEISVLGQSASGHKKRYCGTSEEEYFYSKSDAILIYFYPRNSQFDVTLTFSVDKNFYMFTGIPSENNFATGKVIETPYFPNSHPLNYRTEYVLQSDDLNSHVVLLFLDFQISNQSFIEVTGNNGTHRNRFYGSMFRPPAIVSESHQLGMKFESNNQLYMPGFRALCSFVKTIDSLSVPYTDCGGLKDGRFGYMNIKPPEKFSLYDCIWLINSNSVWPISSFSEWSIKLSVSIKLKDIGHKSKLEFRDGQNSKSKVVKIINCENGECSKLVETTVHTSRNLYIRFSGYLKASSIIDMTYSMYHTGNCSNNEFACGDGRCLLISFQCDGIQQCPNGFDEENCLTTEVKVTSDSSIKREDNLDHIVYDKFVVFVIIGALGLAIFSIAMCFFIYKYYKLIPVNIERTRSQVIREIPDVPILYANNVHRSDDLPSYEDFIKSPDCYLPLLYTRAKQFIPKDTHECTTSFSSKRPRYHSVNSFNLNSDDVFVYKSTDMMQETSNCCTVEIFNSHSKRISNSIKKWYSLDSKLNDLAKKDTCQFFLSIIHPVCNASSHLAHVQCHTLPSNFKMSHEKSSDHAIKLNAVPGLPNASLSGTKDRSCSWSFGPCNSCGSEILTVVKTRCCSDPCNGISVHYSLN